jgi:hypothetical protein
VTGPSLSPSLIEPSQVLSYLIFGHKESGCSPIGVTVFISVENEKMKLGLVCNHRIKTSFWLAMAATGSTAAHLYTQRKMVPDALSHRRWGNAPLPVLSAPSFIFDP